MELVTVPGVEIFRAGVWHGDRTTNADIMQMAHDNNSILPYFRAKLKLTHKYAQPSLLNDASFGRVTRFYTRMRDGLLSLYADFQKVPDVVARALKTFYPERSIEVPPFTRHPQTGEIFTNIISAIAFLGSTPPEVKGMLDDFAALNYQQQIGGHLSKEMLPVFFSQAAPAVFTIIMSQFAEFLVKRREELKLTPEDVAKATGIAVEVLAQIEQGAVMPADVELQKLAEALQVPGGVEALLKLIAADQQAGNDGSKAGDAGQQQFEQGVKAATKLFEQQLSKQQAEFAALVREHKQLQMRTFVEGLQAAGLPNVFAGADMVAFLSSLDQGAQQFAAEGQPISQLEYMKGILYRIAQGKATRVPVEPSPLDKEPRQIREYEQAAREPQSLAAAIAQLRTNPELKDTPYQELWQRAAQQYPGLVVGKE